MKNACKELKDGDNNYDVRDYISNAYINLFNADFIFFYAFYFFVYDDIAWDLMLKDNFLAFINGD